MAYRLAWKLERGTDADGDPTYIDVTVVYRYAPGGFEDIDGSGRRDYPVGPDVEVESVIASDGSNVLITDAERKELEDSIVNDPPFLGPDPDDERDRLIEDRERERSVSYDNCEAL